MYFQKVYYVRSSTPKVKTKHYGITDPPTAGYSRAFILPPENEKSRLVTVFCPYTMRAFSIPADSREVIDEEPINITSEMREKLTGIIMKNWNAGGEGKSYSVATTVLRFLKAPIPVTKEIKSGNKKTTGGKPVAKKLLKLIKKKSKRGQIAEYFLGDDISTVHEAMSLFKMSRSGVLTHLHNLHTNHGLGYVLNNNNTVELLIPNCKTIFEKEK